MKFIMGQDQFGKAYHDLGKHPLKELLGRLGAKHATKMYQDKADGSTWHTGYIIAGHWISLYYVEPLEKKVSI